MTLPPEIRASGNQPAAMGVADASRDVEFIKAMIEWTRDDVRQVYLRVTGALAVAVLFLTQLPFDKLAALGTPMTVLLLSGLGLLLASAALHFIYLSRVHRSHRDLAACLRGPDGDEANKKWEKVWRRWQWAFIGGDVLIAIALLLLAVVLAGLLHLPVGKS